MSETTGTPYIGQVRQEYHIREVTNGIGIPLTSQITNVTSEAWTGREWVDVRELVECWNEAAS